MMYPITINYYTIADIFGATYDEAVASFKTITESKPWTDVLGGLAHDNTIYNLMNQYVLPGHLNCTVALQEGDAVDLAKVKSEFILRLASWFAETAPKYSFLIKTFTTKESALFDQIASSSKTTGKVVDTPQDDQIDTLNENYLSGITSSTTETKSDPGITMMGRLDEIRRGYRNLYAT